LIKKAHSCRVCEGLLSVSPLLKYENSPRSAQGFLDALEDFDDSVNLEIFQCSYCGLVQHNLPPVPYYKEVIRAVAFSKEMGEFRIEQLHDWIKENNLQHKKILEVGCGRGEYIDLLIRAGAAKVAGIEYAKKSVATAREIVSHIYEGYLDSDFDLPDNFKFDAFTIFSFLEHWPNPNQGLQLIHSILSDKAVGLVEVPNFELILKKGLYSEFTTDHIFYFDKKSFTFLLEKNGFEVISIESIWYDYILSAKIRKRPLLNVMNFLNIQSKIKLQLGSFINQHKKGAVAIWGAGHQALAVIAMAKVADQINYIVDSAPFKQGKFTPATHLPIVGPEHLLFNPPEAVIVMAAGYSNEIVRIILEKYPFIRHIAVLREDELEEVL
jgi:SAM-dependent methyltransferase